MVIETWKEQGAFDAHVKAAGRTQFQSALAPIRVSGYDERPYKSLNVGAGTPDMKGIHVVSHVDIGGGDPAAQAAGAAILAQLANASRKERGLLRFDVLQHAMRANHSRSMKRGRLRRHLMPMPPCTPGTTANRIQPLLGGPVDERLFRPIE
jgi:quinol monooxygenase YgiN